VCARRGEGWGRELFLPLVVGTRANLVVLVLA
jgi:hypothetical protein